MKKLLLLSAVGLVAASCSTTEYYKDDLAVAQRLDEQERQERAQPQQAQRQQPQQQAQQQPTMTRDDFEQQREVKEMQTKLSEIDQRISDIEASMEEMPPAEREQTAREVSELRERQQRAESMLNEADNGAPQEFVEVREELRDAVNELEVGVYRLLVREEEETSPDEIIE